MKRLMIGAAMIALLASPVAAAHPGNGNHRHNYDQSRNQQHDGRQWHEQSRRWDNGRHRGWGRDRGHNARWGRGQQMGYNDWRNARRIDYRRYNLRQPPRGYEWRGVNDRYILASVGTGVIISVILRSGR